MKVTTNLDAKDFIVFLHEECGMSLASIAGAVNASRTSISQIYNGAQSGYNLYPVLLRLCKVVAATYEGRWPRART